MDNALHITEVCRTLGITSRTIRYYEKLGLIKTVRETPSAPRRLDSECVATLKKILLLRRIGMSLEDISGIIKGADAAEVIMRRRKELNDEMAEFISRATLLQEVLLTAEKGGDIFELIPKLTAPEASEELCRTAAEIVNLLIEGRYAELEPYYAENFRAYSSEDMIQNTWEGATEKLGKLVEFFKQKARGTVVNNFLRYEKKDLVVRIGFTGGKLSGIFFTDAVIEQNGGDKR